MKNTPISHESFPQYIENLEARGTKLSGQKIGRTLASVLNMLISSVLTVLLVCVVYCTEDPKEMPMPEAFTHIPGFFRKASQWAMDLLPAGLDKWWICMIVLLCAIPVSGLVSGLIFRFIPFKGKAVKAEEGQTPEERTDNALKLIEKLRSKYNEVTDYFTFSLYVAPVVAGLAVLGLPITSVILANPGAQWHMILGYILVMLIQMFFLLLITLCVLCYGIFWVAVAQEWITSLFYKGKSFKQERVELEKYRTLLDQEAKDNHKAYVEQTEAAAIELLIDGKNAAALKTLKQVEDEAQDKYYIYRMVDLLTEKETTAGLLDWLKLETGNIKSETLRKFLNRKATEARRKLEKLAKETYDKALELLEKEEAEEARALLETADAVDYRDGMALYALADYRAGTRSTYSDLVKKMNHGIEKGMEDEKWEIKCMKAVESIETFLQMERERREEEARAQKAAEEAYWLEVGRQMNMTCPHEVNGYCCRYTTLDNFPHKCYYIDNRRDMYLCSDRK